MIRLENKELREELIAMWQRNFHDSAPYAAFYFDEIYSGNDVLVYEDKDETEDLMGMLHLNPYILHMQGSPVGAHYIVGVATDEDYRRQGVMTQLLHQSFQMLREKGEVLTYLRPVQQDYYLPFDFRFGANWEEIELEYKPACECQKTCFTIENHPKDSQLAADKENEYKDRIHCIHTKITADYYPILEKEAASEFSKVFYLYDGEEYAGRFVAGAQDNFMILSRISCCSQDREAFLQRILDFCEQRYHYGKYQLTLDETWKEAGDYLKSVEGIRVFTNKSKPKIMFRLLDLEKAGKNIQCQTKMKLLIQLDDQHLPEQDGSYIIQASPEGCQIRKNQIEENESESDGPIEDGGRISIGDFTNILFGRLDQEEIDCLPGLTDSGKKLMKTIIPWQSNCIMEHV